MAGPDPEVQQLVDTVHDLLNAPDGEGQSEERFESVRIVLDIPRAWVVLAAWLAIKERTRRAGKAGLSAFVQPGNPGHIDKNVRAWARGYLWRMIHSLMHAHLHALAVSAHPYLLPQEERSEEKGGADLDDGLPF